MDCLIQSLPEDLKNEILSYSEMPTYMEYIKQISIILDTLNIKLLIKIATDFNADKYVLAQCLGAPNYIVSDFEATKWLLINKDLIKNIKKNNIIEYITNKLIYDVENIHYIIKYVIPAFYDKPKSNNKKTIKNCSIKNEIENILRNYFNISTYVNRRQPILAFLLCGYEMVDELFLKIKNKRITKKMVAAKYYQ